MQLSAVYPSACDDGNCCAAICGEAAGLFYGALNIRSVDRPHIGAVRRAVQSTVLIAHRCHTSIALIVVMAC
jgi:hypothetical protein